MDGIVDDFEAPEAQDLGLLRGSDEEGCARLPSLRIGSELAEIFESLFFEPLVGVRVT